jgi:Zn-dependent protease with chaperone function
MEDIKQRKTRKRFPKISPRAFQHPMDLRALEAVKKAKGVDLLIRKVIEYGYERYYYINNIADTVQVTPLQAPMLHDMLREACDILDVDLPELYIDQDPVVNAYTFGSEKPFIVLQSGLVDLLTDDELFGVICHEVGHIKCGHVLYKMVARFLRDAATILADMTFGLGKFITGPLLVAFYEWDRKAELSSDRASLLGVQDVDVVTNTLMKLAGGSTKVIAQLDKDQFLRQAESYKELDSSMLNQFFKLVQVIWRTHPFPALRAREIDDWSRTIEYQNILNGIYEREGIDFYHGPEDYSYGGWQSPPAGPKPGSPAPAGNVINSCPNCDAAVDIGATFCHICGSTIVGAIAVMEKGARPSSSSTSSSTSSSSGSASSNPSSSAPASSASEQSAPPPPKRDHTPRCKNCSAVLKPSDDYCPSCGLNSRFDW